MGMIVSANEIHHVTCDDPHGVGCRAETEKVCTQSTAWNDAVQRGWYCSSSTGRWTCPGCRNFQPTLDASQCVDRWIASCSPALALTVEQAGRLRCEVEGTLRQAILHAGHRTNCR